MIERQRLPGVVRQTGGRRPLADCLGRRGVDFVRRRAGRCGAHRRRGEIHGERGRGPAPLAAAGDFTYVNPDEPAAHGRIVTVRADGSGSATRVRLMAVGNGRSVLRAANPGQPDIEGTRADETMMRAVVVLVGRAV